MFMNPHIVEGCLPFTSLRLDPEDISLSMGAGYVPDAEMRAMCRALEEEIAGICIPGFCIFCSIPNRPVLAKWE